MKQFFPLIVGILACHALSGCDDSASTTIHSQCTRGRVVGPSCNGTLIQLLDDQSLGRTISYNGTVYYNVFGTYTPLPPSTVAGTELTFQLRSATEQEITPQPCLAIYQSFDVPQLSVVNLGCQP